MDDGSPTRTRARTRRARRRRLVVTAAVAVALVVAAAVAFASCSGDDGSDAKKTTSTTKPETKINITLGPVSADSAGPPVTVSADQSQRVLDGITTYVKGAMVQPLLSGKPATADLGGVFDATTLASATTTDRAVVLDEGLPKVTGNLTVTAPPVWLVGLGDQSGNLVLISASVALDTTGETKVKGGPLHIVRRADLAFQPDASGTWKITSYDIVVTREGAGLTPTTTTAATTTTKKKAGK
jgi:hypothetical protein